MHRKVILSLAAMTAFIAFAVVPALASAAVPTLREANGTLVTEPVLATNSGNILLETSLGTVTCTKSKFTADIISNNDTTLSATVTTAEFTGSGSEGKCTSSIFLNPQFKVTVENLDWCLSATGGDAWSISGGACGATRKNLKFTLDNSTLGNCTYERAAVTGTANTNVFPGTLTVGASQTFTKSAGPEFCPTLGTLKGAWTLETENGTAVGFVS